MKYAIAPVLLLAALAFGQSWVVERVDSTAAPRSPVELVKTADGRLWAGYGTKTGAARVACLTDSGWRFTDVSPLARLPSVRYRPFLAASPHGELCLACWDSLTDTNRFYRMVNDTWHVEINPFNDSFPYSTVAYDTSGRLYTLITVGIHTGRLGYGLGHETDSGLTSNFIVQLPHYGFYPVGEECHLTAAADGSPWFFGFSGWEDGTKGDFETDLLHFTGDSWTSVWDVHQGLPGNYTPLPLALVPHGGGVGSLIWLGYLRYDVSDTVMMYAGSPYDPPVAGLSFTAGEVPLVAIVPGPVFAFKTDRWRTESIPGPAGVGGIDIEADDSGQVVIVYSTRDSGLWCARGTDVLGVEESPTPQASSRELGPTILSGASGVQRLASSVVFDAMGRRVLNPRSGVYFVTKHGARGTVRARKVLIPR